MEIHTNFVVGRTATIDEFFDEWGFSAIFLATGAGTPTFMGIPGENLSGVYSANEFLTRVNLMGAYRFPDYDTPIRIGKQVAVIGGGNTAMDAVRTAKRLGAEQAYLIYRRSRAEMPARQEEIHHAEQEGIQLLLLTNPTRIIADDQNWVAGIECQKMELGEPDESGRRRPVAVQGSEFVLPVQTIVEAIGQKPNPIIQSTTPGLSTSKRGTVVTDDGQKTSRPAIFAGGDLARGGATVILAMRDGKTAAAAIHDLPHGAPQQRDSDQAKTYARVMTGSWECLPRIRSTIPSVSVVPSGSSFAPLDVTISAARTIPACSAVIATSRFPTIHAGSATAVRNSSASCTSRGSYIVPRPSSRCAFTAGQIAPGRPETPLRSR